MKGKYYTPTIEEFHIGFEYERLQRFPDAPFISLENPNNEPQWIQHICNHKNLPNNLPDLLDGFPNIRVKHLDREDIESLGWKQITSKNDMLEIYDGFHLIMKPSYPSGMGLKLFKDLGTGLCRIQVEFTSEWWNTLFEGKIKNKSELKKLMIQTEIKKWTTSS